jgi:predicted esterase
MRTHTGVTFCVIIVGLLVSLLAYFDGARADHVAILKDGFTLSGTIKREMTSVSEPGLYMQIPKLNGFYMVDDGARRIVFSPKQVLQATQTEATVDADLRFERKFVRLDNFKLPAGLYGEATRFDEKWDRVFTIETPPSGRVRVPQHLSLLSPYYARVDARRYNWSPHFLTNELDPAIVRSLLAQHPDLKPNGKGDENKRFRLYRFLIRAGMYEEAARELDRIQKEFPAQKERVETSREDLKKLLTAKYVDLVEQAQRVGRHHFAHSKVRSFPEKGMDEKLSARVRALQANMETAENNVSAARQVLEGLPQAVADTGQRQLFSRAAESILEELTPDNAGRLDAFASIARQSKGRAEYTAEQLMALAVSGWLLGNNSAEAKVDTAVRLWQTRELVLEYQRTHNAKARQQMLEIYQATGAVPFDELAELIRHLPPPEPYQMSKRDVGILACGNLPYGPAPVALALYSVQKMLLVEPMFFQTDLPWNFRKGASYQVIAPPEYHPGRMYPVLIALHDSGERPEVMFRRWSTLASQNGYFLVAPQWEQGVRSQYGYTAQEHAAVVDVVRDLRRRFAIDSDRVFLTGLGEGGNMAYDVGLSHPDLFAGVLPIAGRPRYFAKQYWTNAFCLPFYVVDGDQDGDVAKDNRRQFEHWVPGGYPALFIEYKGRGREWFSGELPYMFDWMNRKRRASALPDLGRSGGAGRGDEFQSMRATDNHFYWLSGEDLHDRHINDGRSWSNKIGPAILQARAGEGNVISVTAHGFRRVTIWFSPGIIDFEKPVTVHVNSHQMVSNRKIKPSLETLLEDFYFRGDRQRLFAAKMEITP